MVSTYIIKESNYKEKNCEPTVLMKEINNKNTENKNA
jgi:hypothetical protein